MKTKRAADAYSICRERLAADGIHLRVEETAGGVADIVEVMSKPYLTPTLSPFLNDFSPGNCFWLIAERDGKAILAGGTRYDDLEEMPVSDYWRQCATRHYGNDGNSNPIRVNPLVDLKLNGRLAYFGDLLCKTERGSLRALEYFVCAGQMLAVLKWDPDFTYAWLRSQDVKRGAHVRYGFATRVPKAQIWSDPKWPADSQYNRNRLVPSTYTGEFDADGLNAGTVILPPSPAPLLRLNVNVG